jgi:hypothetical protein
VLAGVLSWEAPGPSMAVAGSAGEEVTVPVPVQVEGAGQGGPGQVWWPLCSSSVNRFNSVEPFARRGGEAGLWGSADPTTVSREAGARDPLESLGRSFLVFSSLDSGGSAHLPGLLWTKFTHHQGTLGGPTLCPSSLPREHVFNFLMLSINTLN